MRILHVLHNSLPLLCGYSIRSSYIVNLQRSMGLQPSVVTSAQHPNGALSRELIDGVEYRRTPAYGGPGRPILREWALMSSLERQVEIAAREIRPDVIHAHSPVLVGLPALRVARRLGIPMVYEVRDLWENACVDRGRFSARSPLYKLAQRLETYVLRRADAVVTICAGLRDELVPRVERPTKVRIVANGVDPDAFHPMTADDEVGRRWNLAGKDVILYAGTFQPYEGLDLLVRSMADTVRRRPDAHLVIAGGTAGFAGGGGSLDPQEARLHRVVADCDLEAHVTFTGRVPHADVKQLYAVADVVAYPRRRTLTTALTTPLKPLEAMAMAKPVIVSDIDAMRELVTDRITGLVFRAEDAADLSAKCDLLLGDRALRLQLGTAARKWVIRERQWSSLICAYQDLYRSITGKPGDESRSGVTLGAPMETVH